MAIRKLVKSRNTRQYLAHHDDYDAMMETWVDLGDHLLHQAATSRMEKRHDDFFRERGLPAKPQTWVDLTAFLLQGERKRKRELPASEWIIKLNKDDIPPPPEAKLTIYDAMRQVHAIWNPQGPALQALHAAAAWIGEKAGAGHIPPESLPVFFQALEQTAERYVSQVDGTMDWYLENWFRLFINPEEEAELEACELQWLEEAMQQEENAGHDEQRNSIGRIFKG